MKSKEEIYSVKTGDYLKTKRSNDIFEIMQTYADQEVSKALSEYKERLKTVLCDNLYEGVSNKDVSKMLKQILTLIDSTNGK
jgi:hypothetical protein